VVAILDARTLIYLVLLHYHIYQHTARGKLVAMDVKNNMNTKKITKNRKMHKFSAKKDIKGCYISSLPLDKIP
jgi:hypothetical protein